MHLIKQREPLVCEFLDFFEGEGLATFHSAAVNCLASHDTSLFDVLHHCQDVLIFHAAAAFSWRLRTEEKLSS